VAVKLLRESAAKDQETTRRFRRESDVATMLEHENLVTAFEAGRTAGGQLFSHGHGELRGFRPQLISCRLEFLFHSRLRILDHLGRCPLCILDIFSFSVSPWAFIISKILFISSVALSSRREYSLNFFSRYLVRSPLPLTRALGDGENRQIVMAGWLRKWARIDSSSVPSWMATRMSGWRRSMR
jgi:hypothetical protein